MAFVTMRRWEHAARGHPTGVVVVVALACLATFLLPGRISRLLGHTGNIVLSPLLGVLLAAPAVQYVVDGIRAVVTG